MALPTTKQSLHARRPSLLLEGMTGDDTSSLHGANPEDLHVSDSSSRFSMNGRSSLGDAETGQELDEKHEIMEARKLLSKDTEEKLESGAGTKSTGTVGTAQGQQKQVVIPAFIIIPVWIGLSGSVILLNKHIFTGLHFPYPVFMTAYHMFFAMIGTRLLRWSPIDKLRPKPLDMDWHLWSRTILPLSLLFSGSLVLSNMAYVHLSVSFVQMLKAFIPIFTLIVQLVAGLQEYNHLLFAIVAITATGCITAAAGEIKFALFGFICQGCAVVVESVRLVLVQIILKEYKMDPLSSIAMYAPVCLVLIAICQPFLEGPAPFHNLQNVGAPIFILNGLIAFCLNVAGVFLIESAGSLVLTLSGVGKDVLLILLAWLMGSYITFMQTVGYSIAICGLMIYRLTGGSPNTPNGQRLLHFNQTVMTAPVAVISSVLRPLRALGPSGTRFAALLGLISLVALGSMFVSRPRVSSMPYHHNIPSSDHPV